MSVSPVDELWLTGWAASLLPTTSVHVKRFFSSSSSAYLPASSSSVKNKSTLHSAVWMEIISMEPLNPDYHYLSKTDTRIDVDKNQMTQRADFIHTCRKHSFSCVLFNHTVLYRKWRWKTCRDVSHCFKVDLVQPAASMLEDDNNREPALLHTPGCEGVPWLCSATGHHGGSFMSFVDFLLFWLL